MGDAENGHPLRDGLSPTVEPEVSPLRASIPDAGVFIPRELFDFLMGVGEIEGVSFGELNSGRLKGRFWWRALLRCAENTQPEIIAKAIEARRVETPAAPSIDESAVAKPFAHKDQ